MQKQIQEGQYFFPYHYIPQWRNGNIIHCISFDSAGLYLKSIRTVGRIVDKYHPRRVLDVGCGDGRIVNELANLFSETSFHGIDVSERAIEFAKLYSSQKNVLFEVFDICDQAAIKINGHYDLVTLVEVLEHIPVATCQDFFNNVVAFVKSGGLFHLIVPHINKKVNKKHFQHFDSQKLKEIVSLNGKLEIVETVFLDDVSIFGQAINKLANNRFYLLKFLWRAILKRQFLIEKQKETKCGRISLLLKKTRE